MSRLFYAAAIAASIGFGGAALAQSTAPNNSSDNATNAKNLPGMADTSSDMGNLGTGASSSKIGTGDVSHGATGQGGANAGVMSPTAPGVTGEGATGANPNSSGGTSQ
jgi:hypothetical protein